MRPLPPYPTVLAMAKTPTDPTPTQPDDITEEELAALALAGDVDAPLDPAAVSIWSETDAQSSNLLPAWYMPTVSGMHTLHDWRRWVVLAILVSFLAIATAGLSNTYGDISFD